MPQAISPDGDDTATFEKLAASAGVKKQYVARLLGIHPATVDRKVKKGFLPPPIDLGDGTKRWRVGDLRKLLAGKAAA